MTPDLSTAVSCYESHGGAFQRMVSQPSITSTQTTAVDARVSYVTISLHSVPVNN